MKKFILPLILILFLSFTLIGNCDWLEGWDYRIELKIEDYAGDIGHDSKYPTAHTADYVKATTTFGAGYYPYYATDPERSVTGGCNGLEWLSDDTEVTNQRFHIDLGSAKIISRIYYENSHNSGADTNHGVQNFIFQGSNTGAGTFDDLVYANDEGWTTLTTSQSTFDEHVGADQADPKYITVTNNTAYRYYAFKFADNYGDATFMGVRRIELQEGVTWFPVTVFLTDSQAEEVFTELTTDAEYLKTAVTKADGTTQLYAEFEIFDVSETNGIFHTSRDGWTVDANTSIFLYYDSTHADNTDYIGAIGARTEVWDGNHKIVYHQADLTTSSVEDSTSNSNDGTKASANNPVEAIGKIGQGQIYDTNSDAIYSGAALDAMSNFTLETLVKFSSADGGIDDKFLTIAEIGTYNDPSVFRYTNETIQIYADGAEKIVSTTTIADTNWHHVAIVADGTYIRLYIDGVEDGSSPIAYTGNSANKPLHIGDNCLGTDTFTGTLDESRVSDTKRSAAWEKGSYNSSFDTLFTYGSEETEEVEEENAIFFGCNF